MYNRYDEQGANIHAGERWMQPSRCQRPNKRKMVREWLWAALFAVVISSPFLAQIAKDFFVK